MEEKLDFAITQLENIIKESDNAEFNSNKTEKSIYKNLYDHLQIIKDTKDNNNLSELQNEQQYIVDKYWIKKTIVILSNQLTDDNGHIINNWGLRDRSCRTYHDDLLYRINKLLDK